MRTDHEELCGSSYGSFCLNGGICYTIPTASNPFCRCVDNYTGARCEAVLLPSIKSHSRGELFVAVLASVVVLSVLVAGAIFFLCRPFIALSHFHRGARERKLKPTGILGLSAFCLSAVSLPLSLLARKGQIPRATALERGEHLIEGNSSDACNKITK
ncbi:pro-neuregulin-4, membrane-bound isoform isoform X2 [Crotalus tigris]|uniref:pro-neuregulin-4, membrane-bound isoform isoform X2 n=1 Tax=Crotalus tigris TaxID=88082 RepID=UPI00192F7506|nr:pro-neuregulin-4, membrane-bound isoform isoform X2 [Crotalus tigris]